MAEITLGENTVHTVGELPAKGSAAPEFELVARDLSTVTLADSAGKRRIVNIFPSIDTGVCARSAKTFHQRAAELKDVVVLNVSLDLPFAHERFCAAEGIEGAQNLSSFRSSFGDDWGVRMTDGALAGLLSRAVVVLDGEGRVLYTEQVPSIGQDPDYDAALAAAG